jgi:hypothetical protein
MTNTVCTTAQIKLVWCDLLCTKILRIQVYKLFLRILLLILLKSAYERDRNWGFYRDDETCRVPNQVRERKNSSLDARVETAPYITEILIAITVVLSLLPLQILSLVLHRR